MTNPNERFPRNTPELFRYLLPAKWRTVLDLSLIRLNEETRIVEAVLKNGEVMKVMLPEGISAIVYCLGDYEPEVTMAMEHILKPGMVVCNVGAHVGLRVVQGAKLVGKEGQVSAFEPTSWSRKLLGENAQNRAAGVLVFPNAVGGSEAMMEMSDFGVLYGALNTLAGRSRYRSMTTRELKAKSVRVEVVTLDKMVERDLMRKPDLLVIDAEGFEEFVLIGASKLLRESKPVVIFEVGDLNKNFSMATISVLRNFGYVLFEVDEKGLIRPHELRDQYAENGNLIAIHPQASRGIFSK